MIKVKVPATSANLGAGFDVLGMSLGIYNYFSAKEIQEGLIIHGCEDRFKNENNLVYKAIKFLYDKRNEKLKGIEIIIDSKIPPDSGMGSSATCIVAGLLIGNKMLGNIYSQNELLEMAIDIEGHADNVAPAMVGGLTITMNKGENHIVKKTIVHEKIKVAVLISNQKKKSTKALREILPQSVSLKDCVFNLSHALVTVESMKNGDVESLKYSMDDKIHEKYRGEFIKNFDYIKKTADENNGISLNISGSGPTLILIYDEKFKMIQFEEKLKKLSDNWEIVKCGVENEGANYL